ncbi:unnamed protein product, partial [Linum tenue]
SIQLDAEEHGNLTIFTRNQKGDTEHHTSICILCNQAPFKPSKVINLKQSRDEPSQDWQTKEPYTGNISL